MKKRNPLFVAGFPYILVFVGYVLIYGTSFLAPSGTNDDVNVAGLVGMLLGIAMFAVGGIYSLYWQISTARVLRKSEGTDIPNAILLFVPFANLWWQYKYGEAAEIYTKGKVQAVLGFILLFLLGSIGMGILQDYYNKVDAAAPVGQDTPVPVDSAPLTNPTPPAEPAAAPQSDNDHPEAL